MEEWTTVARFMLAYQADLAKGRLEAEGIPVRIFNEATLTLNPLLGPALGGFEVQVPTSQVAKAQRILKDIPQAIPSNEL